MQATSLVDMAAARWRSEKWSRGRREGRGRWCSPRLGFGDYGGGIYELGLFFWAQEMVHRPITGVFFEWAGPVVMDLFACTGTCVGESWA